MNKQEILLKIRQYVNDPNITMEEFDSLMLETSYMLNEDKNEMLSFIYEAMGDVCRNKNQWVEIEKNYLEMLKYAKNNFDINQEQHAYRLGFVSYKIGNFYRTALRCTQFGPNPIVLSDTQEKLFMSCEIHYKNAVACTVYLAKQGDLHTLELHSTAMNELSVLYTAVGKYEEALKVARDGVRIDKSIYEKINDKTRCFLYGNRLNNLATIYLVSKDHKNAMETYETSVTILKQHKNEEPITYGILLGKNYLALGNCYSQIKEKESIAITAFQNGLDYMENVNVKTKNALIYDVITSYMIVGDYYKRTNKNDQANRYYSWAMNHSKEMLEKTNEKKYEHVIKRLQSLM